MRSLQDPAWESRSMCFCYSVIPRPRLEFSRNGWELRSLTLWAQLFFALYVRLGCGQYRLFGLPLCMSYNIIYSVPVKSMYLGCIYSNFCNWMYHTLKEVVFHDTVPLESMRVYPSSVNPLVLDFTIRQKPCTGIQSSIVGKVIINCIKYCLGGQSWPGTRTSGALHGNGQYKILINHISQS